VVEKRDEQAPQEKRNPLFILSIVLQGHSPRHLYYSELPAICARLIAPSEKTRQSWQDSNEKPLPLFE